MIGSRQRTDTNHHLRQQALWACFVMWENRFTFSCFIYLLQLWWGIKTYFIQRGAQALYQQWQKVVILPWIISLRQSFCKWVGCFSEQGQQTRSILLPPHLWLPAMVQTDQQNYNLFTSVKRTFCHSEILAKQTAVQNLSWYRVVSGAVWC